MGGATDYGRFTTLVTALKAADLVEPLSGEGPFTVFAPTDDALALLPAGLLDCLLLPENKEILADILTYHVAGGKVMSTNLTDGQEIRTARRGATVTNVTISIDGETVKVNNSTVIVADVEADNGVIHAIDGVLVPDGVDVAAFLASYKCEEPGDGDSGAALLSVSAAMVGVGLVTAFF